MKKRILSFLTPLVLSLSAFNGLTVAKAIDGLPDLKVYGPTLEGGGIISWDAYPGAVSYKVETEIASEYLGTQMIDTSFDPEGALAGSSCKANGYTFIITAFNSSNQAIAKGKSGSYPYHPNGTMTTPGNPHWNGPVAYWNTVMNADSYKINLYENGKLIDVLIMSGQNHVDLTMWLMNNDSDYTFTVASRQFKWEISDMSAQSPARKGRVKRAAGATRYETGRQVADLYRILHFGGWQPLDGVVLANGDKFPDALGGAYLSWKKNSPIILINEYTVTDTIGYIKNNVKSGSTVYVLGGEAAVSDSWLTPLKSAGFKIKRLDGEDRFETNLSILNETKVPDKRLLICTGENFADALSASGVSYPIMLVSSTFGLTESQKKFLSGLSGTKAVILGGINAVTTDIENELKKYLTIEKRLAGASRFETSLEIADYFFGTVSKTVITTGLNFPDGLTGGLLAHQVNGPLILAGIDFPGNQKIYNYLAKSGLFEIGGLQGYVLGGDAAVSTGTVFEIFNGVPSY